MTRRKLTRRGLFGMLLGGAAALATAPLMTSTRAQASVVVQPPPPNLAAEAALFEHQQGLVSWDQFRNEIWDAPSPEVESITTRLSQYGSWIKTSDLNVPPADEAMREALDALGERFAQHLHTQELAKAKLLSESTLSVRSSPPRELLCGVASSRGQTCFRFAMANGRCVYHGGASTDYVKVVEQEPQWHKVADYEETQLPPPGPSIAKEMRVVCVRCPYEGNWISEEASTEVTFSGFNRHVTTAHDGQYVDHELQWRPFEAPDLVKQMSDLNQPTDPLDWVSWKFWLGDKQYGDWVPLHPHEREFVPYVAELLVKDHSGAVAAARGLSPRDTLPPYQVFGGPRAPYDSDWPERAEGQRIKWPFWVSDWNHDGSDFWPDGPQWQ